MDHSGNTGTPIDQTYGFGQVKVKIYVHDEVGRFFTRATVHLSRRQIEEWHSGMQMFERDHADDPLPFEI